MQPFRVDVGFQVYFKEGGEEIGAVRRVGKDHLVVYIEGKGDFVVQPQSVHSAHDGKLLLDPAKVEQALLDAAGHAHELETD